MLMFTMVTIVVQRVSILTLLISSNHKVEMIFMGLLSLQVFGRKPEYRRLVCKLEASRPGIRFAASRQEVKQRARK